MSLILRPVFLSQVWADRTLANGARGCTCPRTKFSTPLLNVGVFTRPGPRQAEDLRLIELDDEVVGAGLRCGEACGGRDRCAGPQDKVCGTANVLGDEWCENCHLGTCLVRAARAELRPGLELPSRSVAAKDENFAKPRPKPARYLQSLLCWLAVATSAAGLVASSPANCLQDVSHGYFCVAVNGFFTTLHNN